MDTAPKGEQEPYLPTISTAAQPSGSGGATHASTGQRSTHQFAGPQPVRLPPTALAALMHVSVPANSCHEFAELAHSETQASGSNRSAIPDAVAAPSGLSDQYAGRVRPANNRSPMHATSSASPTCETSTLICQHKLMEGATCRFASASRKSLFELGLHMYSTSERRAGGGPFWAAWQGAHAFQCMVVPPPVARLALPRDFPSVRASVTVCCQGVCILEDVQMLICCVPTGTFSSCVLPPFVFAALSKDLLNYLCLNNVTQASWTAAGPRRLHMSVEPESSDTPSQLQAMNGKRPGPAGFDKTDCPESAKRLRM